MAGVNAWGSPPQTDAPPRSTLPVQVWTGGVLGNFSLLNACVTSGCGVGGVTLGSLGFTKLATNLDVTVGNLTSVSAPTAGRYMRVSAALGTPECNGLDAFKLTSVTGGYVTAVPEPSTWALMLAGFGVAGFVCHHRRAD